MKRSLQIFFAFASLFIFLAGCNHNAPLVIGDWQLEKIDGLYPPEIFSKDTIVLRKLFASRKYESILKRVDSISKHEKIQNVWSRYFERYNLGWFSIEADTHKLLWSFTDRHDSELRIYDDSSRVITRLPSYWTMSDSNIVFSGFNGFYQPYTRFKIEKCDDLHLTLLLQSASSDQIPLRIYLKRISTAPGKNIALSGTKYEDLKVRVLQKNIQVKKKDKHPFLRDHNRELVTITDDGHVISCVDIYPDTGVGCDGNLFENDDRFLFIDCNGSHYDIDKSSGMIKEPSWKWLYMPKEKYLGTYYSVRGDLYQFQYDSAIDLEKIYTIKDPND